MPKKDSDQGKGNRVGPPVERPTRPVGNIRTTVKDQQGHRVGLIDRHDPGRGLLILRGIEAGEGIIVEVVSNDPGVYATSDKVVRISATSTFPNNGDVGEVLTIGPDGERIWATPPGAGGGEANTGTNLAGDTGVYEGKVGTQLRFRGVSGGAGISATQDATTIMLSVDQGDLDLANLSGNLPVSMGGTGQTTFAANSILVGNDTDGITVTPAASEGYLYFNGTGFVWTTPASGENNTGIHLGGDARVYAGKSGEQLQFRGISAGDGIDVFQDVSDIVLSVIPSEITLDEFSGTLSVSKGGTGRTSAIANALLVGNGTNAFGLTPAASSGYLRYTGTNFVWDTPIGEANTGTSLGGAAIYVGKTGDTLEFRGLVGVDGIAITQNVNNLTLSVDESGIDITATTGTLPIARGGTGATTAATARTALGLGTMAIQNDYAVNITGGTASLSSISISGTTALNGVSYTWPNLDGGSGQVLSTNGLGVLEWIDMDAGTGEANTASTIGGTASVYASKVGVDLRFRGITAGTAATVVENADDITIGVDVSSIDITNTTGTLSAARGGTGQTSLTDNAILLGNGTDPVDVLAVPAVDDVYLRYNLGAYEWTALPPSGETNTASSLGGTADVFVQKTDVNFEFRGITAGNAITVTENPTDILLAVDEAGIDLNNTTGTLGVDRGGTGQTTLTANGLLFGNGTAAIGQIAAPGVNDVYLRWNNGAFEWAAIDTTIGSIDDIGDVDLGSAVTTGDVLTFDGVSWTAQATTSGEANTASSLGGEASIYSAKVGVDLQFRGLTSGNAVTLTQAANDVVIAVDEAAIDVTNTTGTVPVTRGGTGQTALTANSIIYGNGTDAVAEIAAPTTADTFLSWNGTTFEWAAVAAGGGATSLEDLSDVDFGSAGATNGDILTFDGTIWTAQSAPGGGEVNTASNLGGTATIFAQKNGVDFEFRGFTPGNAVTLTQNPTDIVVAVDEAGIDVTNTTGTLPLTRGGTGAIDAGTARTNLGLGTIATQDADAVAITGGDLSGVSVAATTLSATGATTFNGVAYTWPVTDGTVGQILSTGGDGTLTWIDAAAGGGEANDGASLGGDVPVYANKTGTTLNFRGITSGSGVDVTDNTTDIILSINEGEVNLANLGGTLTVGQGGTGVTNLTANGVLVGNGTGAVTATAAPTTADTFLQWNGTGFAWAALVDGEANTASNLGAGSGVFAAKDGIDLQFRSLTEGNAITLAQTATEISVAVDEAGIDITNTTGLLPVNRGGTGMSALTANGILFGNGTGAVGVTNAPTVADTFLQWNGTAFVWAPSTEGETNTASNLGTGEGIFATKVGEDLQFKSLSVGNAITLTPSTTDIVVAVDESGIDVANTSGTLPLARGGTGGNDAPTARTNLGLGTMATQNANNVAITGGTATLANITVGPRTVLNSVEYFWPAVGGTAGQVLSIDGVGNLSWQDTAGGEANTASSLGGEASLIGTKTGTDLPFRGLSGGNAITVTQQTNDVLIAVVEGEIDITATTGTLSVTRGGTGATTLAANGILVGNGTDPVATVVAPTTADTYLQWNGTGFVWAAAAGGEANTASNLGAGEGVFSAKVGDDLQFRSLTTGNAITFTPSATEIQIGIDEAGIDVTNTTGTLGINRGGTGATDAGTARTNLGLGTIATQDADAVAITGGTATLASIAVTGTTTLNTVAYTWPGLDGGTGQILSTNGTGGLAWIDPPAGGGEANTASSLGGEASLVGTKNGVDLPFRGLTGGNAITVTQQTNDVLIDVAEGDIDVNNTTGTLGVARGGTGATTLTANGVLIGNGTGAVGTVAAPTTADTYLSWNGTGFAWAAVAGGGGATSLDELSDVDTTTVAPTTGDVLSYDGTNWVPENDAPVTVADDGTTIGTQRQINFTGAGVTVTDDGANGQINVAIPGGGGSTGTFDGPYSFRLAWDGFGTMTISEIDPIFSNPAISGSTLDLNHSKGTNPVFYNIHGWNGTWWQNSQNFNIKLQWNNNTAMRMASLTATNCNSTNGNYAYVHVYF